MERELWTKPIRAYGHEATPEQQREAWAAWLRQGEESKYWMKLNRLATELRNRGVREATTVAERMLKRAKKVGLIRAGKNYWELTDGA